ncbi:MAG: gliding motility-associated C-terminal domain-containing protein [Chitinophagales bacterium]
MYRHFYAKITGVCLVILLLGTKAFATHNMGKDLQYVCLGKVGSNMQYKVTVHYYRNCWDNSFGGPASTAPTTVSLEITGTGCTVSPSTVNLALDNSAVPANGSDVSQLCPAQLPQNGCNWSGAGNPPYPGVQVYTYTGIVNVPVGCGTVTFGTTECCRNGAINNISNPGGEDLSIYATVNNTIDPSTGQPYCNSSVAFTNQPVPFFCLGSNVTFNHGAVDVDGDSLVFQLVNPMDGFSLPYNNINFSGGYSVNCPIRTVPANTFNFDTHTGQMQFVPGFQEQCVLAVRIYEYRNGVLVGSTMRDIQVVILNCAIAIPDQDPITNVQNGNQVDSLSVQVCPGTPLKFDIECTDPANHNLTITSNLNTTPSAIPGAHMTQVGTGDTVIARINWTPLASDTGCHNFVLTAQNNDCPINGSYTRVYTICVFTQVNLLSASPTFCGTPVQLTATGGSNYVWTPSTGPNAVSNPTILKPTVSPTSPTMYYFTSDCGTDSVFVDVAPPFLYDAGPGGAICQNGQLHLNANTDSLYAPYKFKWVPSGGLYDPVSGLPNDTISNPVASPLSTTMYHLFVTGANGCTNEDSLQVNVAGTGPALVAKAQPTSVCPGQQVELNILTNPQSCGISQTPCSGNIATGQIGTGTGVTPTGSPTQYPTVYGHYSASARHQFLYLQSELLSQFPSGGEIRSIAFNVAQINANNDSLMNFEIKMGCTQATSLTNWQPNMVTVFSPKKVYMGGTGNTGWKTHTLDFPYNWDGTSNLVVDICFYNSPNSTALNAKMQMTPTPFQSVYYSKGGTSQCGNTGTPQSSANRPNTRFDICITSVDGMPTAWTPAAGPNAVIPPNNDTAFSYPQTPVIYSVDVTAPNGCTSSDYVFVNVDTSLRFSAAPHDTFFCSPTSVTLTTTTIGSPLPGQSFQYQWINLTTNASAGTTPTITVNPAVSTDYLVTLTGGACTLSDTVHVVVGNNIPVSLTVDSIDCFGMSNGKLFAVAGGGTPPIAFAWSTGTSGVDSLVNLGPGTYSVSITDAQGCTGNTSKILSEPTQVTVTIQSQAITCNGAANAQALATATGGTPNYVYAWSTGNNNNPQTSLGPGNYIVTATDSKACSATASWTAIDPAPITVTVPTVTNVNCFGGNDGTATAVVNGGTQPYTYNWSNLGISANPGVGFAQGNQSVTVTDQGNCTASATFSITQPTALTVNVNTVTNATCNAGTDGAVDITAAGGTTAYGYLWNDGTTTEDLSAKSAGTYIITVTDANSCQASATATISEPTAIVLSFTHTNPLCSGDNSGAATVAAAGGTPGYTYDWANVASTNDNATINQLTSGIYDVTATDTKACSVSGSVTLIDPVTLDAQFINKNEISCANDQDGSIEVAVYGGTSPYNYIWSNGATSPVVANLAPGTYYVTISDVNGCDTTMNTVFLAPPVIDIALMDVDSVSCPQYTDGVIHVIGIGGTPGVTMPYGYSIDGSAFQSSEFFQDLAVGTYQVTIRDGQGCTKDTTVVVGEPAVLDLSILPGDTMIDLGDAVTLFASISNYSGSAINFYNWSPINGLNCNDCPYVQAAPYTHTDYTLTVNYLNNCTVTETVKVSVGDGEDIFVPNAFSPNGDGNNDVLFIYGKALAKANLLIFNRWGEKVYDSQNQFNGWDGYYRGQLQNPGVYTYYLQAVYLNGRTRDKKGTITLIK